MQPSEEQVDDWFLKPTFGSDSILDLPLPNGNDENENKCAKKLWDTIIGRSRGFQKPRFISQMGLESVLEDSSIAGNRILKLYDFYNKFPFARNWPTLLVLLSECHFCLNDTRGARMHAEEVQRLLAETTPDETVNNSIIYLHILEGRGMEESEELDEEVEKCMFYARPAEHIPADESSSLIRLQKRWGLMQAQKDGVLQFERFACVETNELEDVFALDGNSTMKLARCGFYANSIVEISHGSRIENPVKIIKILQNTQRCFDRVYEGCDNNCFEESLLKELHGMLLEGNYLSVEYEDGFGCVSSYVPPGRYRAVPGYTQWMDGSDLCEIRYCPASKIDEEMVWYVAEVKKILLRAMSLEDKDPFRACAWVQWAFVRIHPFADGNGRMARMVSSIPLILNGLPPVYVSKASKPQYLAALIHADNTGDIDELARFLKDEIFNALGRLLEGNDVNVEKAEMDFSSSLTASSSSSSDDSGDSKIQ